MPAVQSLESHEPDSSSKVSNVVDGPVLLPRGQAVPQAEAVCKPAPQTAARIDAALKRKINALTDADRSVRLRAARSIASSLVDSHSLVSADDKWQLLQSDLLRNAVAMLADPVDECRRQAAQIMASLIKQTPQADAVLVPTLAALSRRMGIGSCQVHEYDEELRHSLAELLGSLVRVAGTNALQAAAPDIVPLLARFAYDSYHEVRKLALATMKAFASRLAAGILSEDVGMLLDPIADSLHHQHSRVRSIAIVALHGLLACTPVADDVLSSKVVPSLKIAVADRTATVRWAAYDAIASWAGVRDKGGQVAAAAQPVRYTPHLVPVLLLGITDPSQELAAHALHLLAEAGSEYCRSKAECGYADSSSPSADTAHAAEAAAANLAPPFQGRAPRQARVMVQQQLQAVLPPVLADTREWTTALRLTASRSLYAAAAFAEDALLPHLPALLPALCAAVADEDEGIVARTVSTAHVVGAFCQVLFSPSQS